MHLTFLKEPEIDKRRISHCRNTSGMLTGSYGWKKINMKSVREKMKEVLARFAGMTIL